MRRSVAVVVFAVAVIVSAPQHAAAQFTFNNNAGPGPSTSTGEPVAAARHHLTPLAWYGIVGAVCTTGVSVVQAAMLERVLTGPEIGRNGLSCFLGPAGWWLANQIYPELAPKPAKLARPASAPRSGHGGFRLPPAGEVRFVANEILLRVDARASEQYLTRMASRLGLTRLDIQTFTLTGQTVQRWRIDSGRSVAATIRALARYSLIVTAQPNYLFALVQDATQLQQPRRAQYVVDKLHLIEAHQLTNGDGVLLAIIDSAIDDSHPDLTGVIVDRFDALGGDWAPHVHGTGMAGAIASHGRLIGVAPRVRILAVRAFAPSGTSADGTTFAVLKGLDWAASHDARIVNMSFAGPSDPLMLDMLAKASAKGLVLIAAVGNAGPRSPPLYPAADRHVIGITATDADDKLLPVANRGRQVSVAAPGVDILLPAPGGGYQVSSGTSVAAAHASGIAALMLARNAALTPDQVRTLLTSTAIALDGKRRSNDYGAGLIDTLKAVTAAGPR